MNPFRAALCLTVCDTPEAAIKTIYDSYQVGVRNGISRWRMHGIDLAKTRKGQ